MKKQHDQLREALSHLPTLPAPARVWPQIAAALNQEQGRPYLDQALQAMEATPLKAPLAWEDLEKKLVQQERLAAAVAALPAHKIEKDLFRRIRRAVQRPPARRYWLSGAAAAVLLTLAFSWLAGPGQGPDRETITYSQEVLSYQEPVVLESGTQPDEVLGFIRANCRALQGKCATPRFQGMLNQYLELEAAKQELADQLKNHREQTQLVNYLVRIEKEKTEVGKQLIQYLIS
jgi:hypothetical protein